MPALQQRRAPYLVRMIKPNLIVSHDWHVQPYCQRSLRAVRLSGALVDRGPGCYAKVSSNLLRFAKLTPYSGLRHFCANLLNLSKFRCAVKLRFCGNQACNFSSSAGSFTCLFDRHSGEVSRPQKVALRKISNNDRHQVPSATKAHERVFLSGQAMGLFSAGFPTGAG